MGRKRRAPAMPDHPRSDDKSDQLPHSKAKSRFVMQTKIGEEVKACYDVPHELPPEMLALVMQIYANCSAAEKLNRRLGRRN
jgi:hypothetical protein